MERRRLVDSPCSEKAKSKIAKKQSEKKKQKMKNDVV